ncbi:MAG: NADH-quinone oxidoreductase subunit A [Bryobacterales bacterium]|nr:NADH-quinone oxidoreductase subunit A [Bryobacterales bacterium]MBV9401212.1 NADH-quinone oxidoreductase subunit A [Bryobacterales bacterium]
MLWPFVVYFAIVIALAAALLVVSRLLGERHLQPATGAPYEAGILSEGSAHVRLLARFYLVAVFFVIFDLEAAFIFAWAVAAREVGWQGYWEMVVFVGVLILALIYLWRIGALEWSPDELRKRAGKR